MRLVLPLLVASAGMIGCVSGDHDVHGTFYLQNYDSVLVQEPDGSQIGEAVVDITAKDPYGSVYDEGTFHSQTIDGRFDLTVPDGVRDVHLLAQQRTSDGHVSRVEYWIDGTITADFDVGTLELPP